MNVKSISFSSPIPLYYSASVPCAANQWCKMNHICIVVRIWPHWLKPTFFARLCCHVQSQPKEEEKNFGEKRTKALHVTRRKNQFPQRKNIKIMYSVTKIYLALHENLFLASPKTSIFFLLLTIMIKQLPTLPPHIHPVNES